MTSCHKTVQTMIALIALIVGVPSVFAALDDPLDTTQYSVLEGLGSGICNTQYSGGASWGQVGVSKFQFLDKTFYMAGTIEPFYDDGRPDATGAPECARRPQVYSLTARATGDPIPGLTNTSMGLKISSLCATGNCQWSTYFAGALIDEGSLPDPMVEPQVLFPDSAVSGMVFDSQNDGKPGIVETYFNILLTDGSIASADVIFVKQTVYEPDEKPYFGITWELKSQKDTYTEAKFFYVIDTYTSGNDFGYGYLCDVSTISGGTGGSAFFQGLIGLHPSTKQYEDWWAQVFWDYKHDDFPDMTWSNPLDPLNTAPLTTLQDNAIMMQWDDLTISTDPIYISIRWTFDDPIRQSSYGTTRSLFAISSDDEQWEERNGAGTVTATHEVDPIVFDVQFDPRDWRGKLQAIRNPKPCEKDEECQVVHASDNCLAPAGCTDTPTDPCPRYCAHSTCPCGAGYYCIFGFCVNERKWATEDDPTMMGGSGTRRNLFTITPGTGAVVPFTEASAAILRPEFGVATDEESELLILWMLGEKNNGDNTFGSPAVQRIADENDDNEVDLHVSNLLRSRYNSTEAVEWILGDVTHAEPIYIGSKPQNGWSNDGGPPADPYSDFINSEDYQGREPVLLVSANDGMLHCFSATSGLELWAFVPWDILPKMSNLSKPYYEQLRSPMMNLTPTVHDAYDSAAGAWKTVLIVGSRGGGDHYWAFDISPFDGHLDPTFMWWYSDDDLGMTYSKPTSGRVLLNCPVGDYPACDAVAAGDEKWVVFFGSGYSESSAKQMHKTAFFYVLDLFGAPAANNKAQEIQKIEIKSGAGGVANLVSTPTNNAIGDPIVADMDNPANGYEDAVYAGDLAGNLLRFRLTYVAGSLVVTPSVLFATYERAGEVLSDFKQSVENTRAGVATQDYEFYKYPRPISVLPEVWRSDPNADPSGNILSNAANNEKIMVFFGTGKYDSFYDSFDNNRRNPSDAASPYDHQQIFGIVDRDDGNKVTWGQLLGHTVVDSVVGAYELRQISNDVPAGDIRGWRIQLASDLALDATTLPATNVGERVITDARVAKQTDQNNTGILGMKEEYILFLTTFTPNMQGTCDLRNVVDEGGGFFMTVRADTGGNPRFAVQDVNGDSVLNSSDMIGNYGYAGQKIKGSILSRVHVTQSGAYVKSASDATPIRIELASNPSLTAADTVYYRVK